MMFPSVEYDDVSLSSHLAWSQSSNGNGMEKLSPIDFSW
jgi:hypothetical protein